MMETNNVRSQLNEVILSFEQYLNRSLPVIKDQADRFYKSLEHQPWSELPQLAEAFSWIFQVFESMTQAGASSYEGWHEVENAIIKFSNELEGLYEAISAQDSVAIGDILNYEVLPILEKIHGFLVIIVEQEVT
ncbi:hypothetical protein GC096_22140 [Paenibacillus sp. LMG 31461]|uniref:Uncharacterized protein n=1 Tax=Paenibacillus plantarum TaxID=2654975 RepID=A0ABX1XE39_9BACL|nr:hypothetical protein [Paenibacillus plantarum]NOU66750.1 hypothetical protein [Paenibacillus plantarum]